MRAGRVNIVYTISQMPKISSARQDFRFAVFWRPIIRQLNQRCLVGFGCIHIPRRREKNQGETAGLILMATSLDQPEPVAIKFESRVQIRDP
jgi:hypothetical protein